MCVAEIGVPVWIERIREWNETEKHSILAFVDLQVLRTVSGRKSASDWHKGYFRLIKNLQYGSAMF